MKILLKASLWKNKNYILFGSNKFELCKKRYDITKNEVLYQIWKEIFSESSSWSEVGLHVSPYTRTVFFNKDTEKCSKLYW